MTTFNNRIPSKNTPKGISDNVSVIPSAYLVESMELTNQYGNIVDIRDLVQSFTITEELFSSVIVFNARIRDAVNFFEDFGISGQEKINIRLKKTEGDSPQLAGKVKREPYIDLAFSIKEYPNYEKSTSSINVQEYNLIAVSQHAYLSMLQRISRSIHGNPIENISYIFKNDLNVNDIDLPKSEYSCVSSFDGIITIQSPLKAIEWLKSKCYDMLNAPFFIYKTISNKAIQIKSWSELINSDHYPTKDFKYEYKQYSDSKPDISYGEAMSKIISMKSNIKLDKLKQATSGGFTNKTQITDFGTKSFIEKVFKIDKDTTVQQNRLNRLVTNFKTSSWGSAIGFHSSDGKQNFSDFLNSSISQLSTTSGANNASSVNASHLPAAKSYLSNIESESHEIVIYGDFKLNPGRRISIQIPKSVNDNLDNIQNDGELDESFSGEYVVAVAVHQFVNGIYTTRAKIIRDNS